MYPVSEQFRKAIRKPHKATLRCELWGRVRNANNKWEFKKQADLYPIDGVVDIDARRDITRSISLTIAENKNSNLIPTNGWSALAPFGSEIWAWRGIEIDIFTPLNYATLAQAYSAYNVLGAVNTYAGVNKLTRTNSVREEVPLGKFIITEVAVRHATSGVEIDISGADRSLRVANNKWTSSTKFNQAELGAQLTSIVQNRDAYAEIGAVASTGVTSKKATFGTDGERDPWRDIVRVARASGYEAVFDANGKFTVFKYPDPVNALPVAQYAENKEAMVITMDRRWNTERTFNYIIVSWTSNSSSGRSIAFDNDPASPTYYQGPFGTRVKYYSDSLTDSSAKASALAPVLLNKAKGAAEELEWTQIVDPSLEPSDAIALVNSGTGINSVYVLDRVSIPLTVDRPMTASTRVIRSLNGGKVYDDPDL
jgi:hypothetical protein